ncbi:hypothetical protein DW352_14445 [Pseudolabrys taiwanensis]|uniref:Uncharacterized protein n=1 Tax=Pseudolabrys taiwanensis TaxID=331696 RepID=A0A345ZXG5_9HYPH|nr:hypothetical protein [Pseudolabrys taiwanensis]AXK81612.1 hypothetical protein DW352_14445 [Pseudolabrys taiwanensis]
MGFFDLFRREARISGRETLVDFLDQQAAFLAQKGLYEYSRARAGPYGNLLFDEPAFLAEIEKARWAAYPATLAMVAETVDGVLRPAAGDRREAMLRGVNAAALAAFDRYRMPAAFDAEAWAHLRQTLEHDLASIGLHPVKRVMDVPARYLDRYVEAMPIHEKLKGKDVPTIHNYLRTNLCHVHDAFVRRADVPAVVAALV